MIESILNLPELWQIVIGVAILISIYSVRNIVVAAIVMAGALIFASLFATFAFVGCHVVYAMVFIKDKIWK